MTRAEEIRGQFIQRYGREPRLFRAPGRVNLIGEHTDYNGGFVMPIAIDKETVVATAVRDDRIINVRTADLNEDAVIDLDDPEAKLRGSWIDYVEGVLRVLERSGHRLTGADILISSTVPPGSGLSSSAALEMSIGLAALSIAEVPVDQLELAKAGQTAEHEFVGAKVGIMDQFVSVFGREGHALLLDCRTLAAEHVPFRLAGNQLVIINSNVHHELASSQYNARRAECSEGIEILRRSLPDVEQLRDVSADQLEAVRHEMPDSIYRRCRHVISENERTLRAADALKDSDIGKFGAEMWSSHESLRADYEVSCPELDLLVELASQNEAVLGARMTGGGFGGCTVNVLRSDSSRDAVETITRRYRENMGIEATVFTVEPSNGASELI
jgi:galactokinase